MGKEIWLGLARHILTALGGYLVARGTLDAATAEAAVGAVVTLGGVAWSVADKKLR
jgi:hypothetical protein